MDKKNAEFNFTSFLFITFFYSIRRFRDIERFWEKNLQNAQYLTNTDSDQKSVTNTKTAELKFASFLVMTLF